MKALTLSGCLFILCCIQFSCKSTLAANKQSATTVQKGIWQYAPIRVDGNDSEWHKPTVFFDSEANLSYTVTNDRNYLYLLFKTTDKLTQAKILKNGFRLQLSIPETKKQMGQLLYPMPNNSNLVSVRREDIIFNKKRNSSPLGIYELKDFKEGNGLHTVDEDRSGLQLRMSRNQEGELVYEMRLPFKLFYHHFLVPADIGLPIALVYSIDGFPASDRSMPASLTSPVVMIRDSSGGEGHPVNPAQWMAPVKGKRLILLAYR